MNNENAKIKVVEVLPYFGYYEIPGHTDYLINGCYEIIDRRTGIKVEDPELHHKLRSNLSRDWDVAMMDDIRKVNEKYSFKTELNPDGTHPTLNHNNG